MPPQNQPSQEIIDAINHILDRGLIAVVITLMAGSGDVGAKLIVEDSGAIYGTLGDDQLNSVVIEQAARFLDSREETKTFSTRDFAGETLISESLLLFERLQPRPRLVVCGAGHVGAALAKLGSFLGFQTTLIDDRAQFVSSDRFKDHAIELIAAEEWGSAVRTAIGNGKGVSVAVVTRGHNEDEECLHAVVETEPDYVGLIGSKRRTNIVIEHLRESGVSERLLKSIHAPIGLDIGAVTPEEVALAIIAEIVAERRGAKGGSLSAWRRSA